LSGECAVGVQLVDRRDHVLAIADALRVRGIAGQPVAAVVEREQPEVREPLVAQQIEKVAEVAARAVREHEAAGPLADLDVGNPCAIRCTDEAVLLVRTDAVVPERGRGRKRASIRRTPP
jgi:hypothetical protein